MQLERHHLLGDPPPPLVPACRLHLPAYPLRTLGTYFFEPYGRQLQSRSILKAYEEHIRPLGGWCFKCIEVQVQPSTDGCSCGVWDLVADHAFVAYVDSDSFGSGSFGAFFVSWLQRFGVSDLHAVRGTAGTRVDAISRNMAFIRGQRAALRERLLQAARTGKLAWQDGPLVDTFVPDETTRLSAEELDALDE